MKIFAYLPVLLLIVSCNPSTNHSSESQNDTLHQIKEPVQEKLPTKLSNTEDIQSEYSAVISSINNQSMDSVSFKYDCDGEKRGTVTSFSENGKIRMIKHSYSEYDHFEATDQYLIKDSSLFFVYAKELAWSFDSNSTKEGGTRDNITERRTYIIEQQAVKCLEKKYVNYSYKANPPSGSIANKEVKCVSLKPIENKYERLVQYIAGGGKGCPVK